jgi:hypothetical protein
VGKGRTPRAVVAVGASEAYGGAAAAVLGISLAPSNIAKTKRGRMAKAKGNRIFTIVPPFSKTESTYRSCVFDCAAEFDIDAFVQLRQHSHMHNLVSFDTIDHDRMHRRRRTFPTHHFFLIHNVFSNFKIWLL